MLTISDDTGKQIRRLDLLKDAGVHRIAWDLRGETPTTPPGEGRGARGGGAGGEAPPEAAQFFGGRGRQGGPPAPAGRYRATIGKMTGDTVTTIGQPQSFFVVAINR